MNKPKAPTQLTKGVIPKEANVALTYKFLKDGKSIKWIEDFFAENQGLKPITVRMYLMDARRLIGTETDMDIDFASLLHDSRYEKIWDQDKDIYLQWCFVPEEPYERANNMDIVRKYSELLKSLKQRENMYGLREKDLMLALHSNISLTRDYKADSFEQMLKNDFDIDKLSLDDRVELQTLLEESYEGDIFEQKDYITEEDEVEKVEIKRIENPQKSKEVVVEGIKEMKDPKPEPKKVVFRKSSSIVLKDHSNPEGSSADKVMKKLDKASLKSIKEKFNKK